MKKVLALLIIFSINGCVENGIWVSFWPTDIAPPSDVEITDHPCGSVLTIRSNMVPKNKDWLKPDAIYEIDNKGKVLRTWLVPIDHYPVGLDQDMVLLAYGSYPESVMSVTTTGHIGVIPSPPTRHLKKTECPPPFNKNFYCSILSTEPVRMLASEPVCT